MKKQLAVILFGIFNLIINGQGNIDFDHISINEGLSQSEVNSICQDSKGFIWFGTLDGLNRYDGYNITVFRKNMDEPHSINSNFIQNIYEDKLGNLWIATLGGGLNLYNNELNSFASFVHNANDSLSVSSDAINFINEDQHGNLIICTQKGFSVLRANDSKRKRYVFHNYYDFEINACWCDLKGNFWLGTWNGLYKFKFDPSGKPEQLGLYQNSNQPGSISSNGILSLFQDKSETLWIGTTNGLNCIKQTDLAPIFEHVNLLPNNNKNICNQVLSIFEDRNKDLWVGTRGGGLICYSPKRGIIVQHQSSKAATSSLSNNSVKCIYEDRTGCLWIGTLGGGVNKIDLLRKQFHKFQISLNNSTSAPSNFIRVIYEDSQKLLWLGTLDGGLYTYNRNSNEYTHFTGPETDVEVNNADRLNKTYLYGKNVFSIFETPDNSLWIGTNGGVNILNRKTGKFSYHVMDYNNPDSLISNSVFSITSDDEGNIWLGSWGGLHKYLASKKKFLRFTYNPNDSNSISSNVVRFVYNDPLNKDLWLGTLAGGLDLVTFNRNSYKIYRYQNKSSDPNSISNNDVNMILRSSSGDLWVATSDGLNKLIAHSTPEHYFFKKYNKSNGLAGNHVQSILEDPKGHLWLGTNKGLSEFDPSTEVFQNYDVSDGLQSNEFSEHACYKSTSGEMFFGGVDGFNAFSTDSIKPNTNKPVVAITGLLIFNQYVSVGQEVSGNIILEKSISETPEITLSYKDNVITFEFTALHFASPGKNKFAYKLEGFSDTWLETDAGNRKATFTNLKGGTYYFKVKASNNDGLWNDTPVELKINITPPFWKTWQAYVVYFFIISLLIYAIVKDVKSREKLKSEIILEKVEKDKAEELFQMKMQFFTNISHEFRTPLTLLLSPLENILETQKVSSFFKDQLMLMHRNARYLLRLTNELIDFQKVETGSTNLCASHNDFVPFVKEMMTSFYQLAESKNIKITFNAENENIGLWFDQEMMTKIINNLMYNALKFTNEDGSIEVRIEEGDGKKSLQFENRFEIKDDVYPVNECVSLIIKDNGIGISPESISNIFNRYYQVGSSDSTQHLGSGIGLALTKSLVLLHKGEIEVASEKGKGTEFIIRFRIGSEHFDASQKINSAAPSLKLVMDENYQLDAIPEKISIETDQDPVSLMLIVEDNEEMRHFIKSNLKNKFKILEAENGAIGYDMAVKHTPDIVVSDVIMPEMDGINLCSKLKKNILTSHIPVVLLTALSSVSHQIEGLETGADDYISKPFNLKLFEIRVQNLIISRKQLRERFSKEIELESKDITLNWRDQQFLDKAIKLVRDNISDPELSVDGLSKNLSMSRMHFHRKITALTDQTPSDFIRTIRLKEAARLLSEKKYNISEIAYQVGISPSYFSVMFHKQFGVSPTEYLDKF